VNGEGLSKGGAATGNGGDPKKFMIRIRVNIFTIAVSWRR